MAALPDAALVGVLAHLSLLERQRVAVLVGPRWRDAAHSPALLRRLVIRIPGDERLLPRLRSLSAWLQKRAAPHVEDLELELVGFGGAAVEQQEARVVLAAMLVGCSRGGQLSSLRLRLRGHSLGDTSWLAWMGGRLHNLHLLTAGELTVGSLEGLSGLQSLVLVAHMHDGLVFLPSARLPSSLTQLHLKHMAHEALPPQIGALKLLQDLTVWSSRKLTGEGYALLCQLSGSLRQLTLAGVYHLPAPACLAQLTALEALHVSCSPPPWEAAGLGVGSLQAALPHLSALTSLCIEDPGGMARLPAEVATLPQLRCFAWLGDATGTLPAGTWLSSLQRLVAPTPLLAHSLQQLAAAGQLGQLGLVFAGKNPDQAAAIIRWAQQHPRLERIVLHASYLQPVLATAVLRAQRSPPRLQIGEFLRITETEVLVDVFEEPNVLRPVY